MQVQLHKTADANGSEQNAVREPNEKYAWDAALRVPLGGSCLAVARNLFRPQYKSFANGSLVEVGVVYAFAYVKSTKLWVRP
jgi:hypothetical protein